MANLSYGGSSVLERGPMSKCSGCGRPFEKKQDHDTHCCDCSRLIRLGLSPKRPKTVH